MFETVIDVDNYVYVGCKKDLFATFPAASYRVGWKWSAQFISLHNSYNYKIKIIYISSASTTASTTITI